MFSHGLEIVSTFNIHHPVYMVALFMSVLIWLSSILLTIALAGPVRLADNTSSGEKSKLIFLKTT